MILPMKKISLIVINEEKEEAMRQLRKLGLVHIESRIVSSSKLIELQTRIKELEKIRSVIQELAGKKLPKKMKSISRGELYTEVEKTEKLLEEKKNLLEMLRVNSAELERIRGWGDFDPEGIQLLKEQGVRLTLCEFTADEYEKLDEDIKTIRLSKDKYSIRAAVVSPVEEKMPKLPPGTRTLALPSSSASKMREAMESGTQRIEAINRHIGNHANLLEAFDKEIKELEKESLFETNVTGMEESSIYPDEIDGAMPVSLACLTGYIPAEDLEALQSLAKEKAWGLASKDPTPEDNVPTKLRNNKLVSLIYPLTDFLGTVPGYFEYDVSSFFLIFMLIFFGIIFGDGGYGLLITACAAIIMIRKAVKKEKIPAVALLIGLFGVATIVWGTLTCTWFGLEAEYVPAFLQKISLPVISNVYGDKLWYPFWTEGKAGLTTAQNLQIFCFLLATVQLSIAHIKSIVRKRRSLSLLGDVGSLMQLIGMFYVVLTLVVNSEVFGLDRVIAGIPIGQVAVYLIGVGFVLTFVFGSYEGSIKAAILDSAKNIISMLLGVVNVFSDIVSYIRLWAVGLAGAAISATINELAGPMLGRLSFMIFAVVLLVFGHGLNMVLNVLSVIVHGVRLNTLEFSSHLGMSWSGHKYEPFKE